ncbi:MAG: fibronectin type III domain-containing protein, partial [Betaproteobacteria bacterium]|nr:fibronectin type III domain-containing protein [Betaproteobacteria bacterium]
MDRPLKRARGTIAALSLITISAIIAACGGAGSGGGVDGVASSGVSPLVLSGVAATGAPMIGQVSIRDSSSTPKEKTVVTGSDGSFSVDVSDMKAPFMLKATGAVGGTTQYSFADQSGTANIHPLSSAAVARAAEVDDPDEAYRNSDSARNEKIKAGLPAALAALKTKLKPLLDAFDVDLDDLIKDDFAADQTGLDAVLDNVKVAISGGTLTITNAATGAVIFTANVKEIENGQFTEDEDDLPKRGPKPAAPTGVSATGGDLQVTIAWEPVADAISYTIYWSTKPSDERARKIPRVRSSSYVQTGLAAGTTYYYTVRAVNRAGRSPHSAEVSATTNGTATTTTAASTTTTVASTTTTAAATTTTAAPTTTTAAPTTTTAAPTTTTAAPTTTTAAPTTTTAAPTTTTAAPTTTTAAPTTTTAAPTTTTAAPTTTTAAPTTTTA